MYLSCIKDLFCLHRQSYGFFKLSLSRRGRAGGQNQIENRGEKKAK